jgi:hypothetical protein
MVIRAGGGGAGWRGRAAPFLLAGPSLYFTAIGVECQAGWAGVDGGGFFPGRFLPDEWLSPTTGLCGA